MRRTRPDSILDHLTPEQDEQLMEWILGRVPYRQIVSLMRDTYQVPTSIRAISKYWTKWGAEHWKARRRDALQMASDVVQEARANPELFSEATLKALDQRAFAMAMDPESSGKELKNLVKILIDERRDGRRDELRDRQVTAQEEALRLDREKFEAAERRLAAARDTLARLDASGGLSQEARAEIEKAMGVL
jgi:hypothetical protein